MCIPLLRVLCLFLLLATGGAVTSLYAQYGPFTGAPSQPRYNLCAQFTNNACVTAFVYQFQTATPLTSWPIDVWHSGGFYARYTSNNTNQKGWITVLALPIYTFTITPVPGTGGQFIPSSAIFAANVPFGTSRTFYEALLPRF